jgi:hypothetical protein
MTPFLLKTFRSNRDIETHYTRHVAVRREAERRSVVRMCVIDDQPFIPLNNLTSYGYKITHLGDIKDVDEIKNFDLILCDIIGVGSSFDNKMQGAALISEIKIAFPEKIVIAYTGASKNNPAAKQALSFADELIKKDDSIERWKDILDKNIAKILNPYEIWERIRIDLIRNRVDTKDILVFEDAYVRSILNKDLNFTPLKNVIAKSSLKSDARSVITGIISSAVFSLIVGS